MPEKTGRIEGIKSGLLESLSSSKPSFRSMGLSIRGWEKQGFETDPRKTQKDVYDSADFNDIKSFYDSYIKDKPITITIVGNKDKIDMEKLSKYGQIIELKEEDILN